MYFLDFMITKNTIFIRYDQYPPLLNVRRRLFALSIFILSFSLQIVILKEKKFRLKIILFFHDKEHLPLKYCVDYFNSQK